MLTAPTPAATPPPSPRPRRTPDWGVLVAAVAVAVGVVLRLWPRPALWLDEAQSIAIAQVPLRDLPSLLRTDGAPPLYYVVLHGWMELFGRGDWVVRLPSALASLATIPVLAVAARRWGGRAAVVPAVVLLATNPFAIRYATETRMYALVALEVAIGLVVLHRALERPTVGRWVPVALVVAALLYTHYWALYLLGGVGLVLVVGAWRRRGTPMGRAMVQAIAAVAVGVALWLPWLGVFRFQAQNTGTPWASRPKPWDLLEVVPALSAGSGRGGGVVAFLLTVLVLLALFGRAVDERRTELDWRTRPGARGLTAVLVLVPTLAVLGGYVSGSAFVTRYLSVIFPLLVLLTAMGLITVGGTRARAVILAVASVVSLGVATVEVSDDRTPARELAGVLETRARPGDVIVYCPDQVGPAVTRELEGTPAADLEQGTYPLWLPPGRVDWIDYGPRHLASRPFAFAAEAVRRAGEGAVWLVWSPGYPPTQTACTGLRNALERLRPGEQEVVPDRPGAHLDHAGLYRYPATEQRALR